MRRKALTVRIAVKFKIESVGTLPFTISIDPILGSAVLHAIGKQTRFSKFLLSSFVVYQFAKVLFAAHKLGPGNLQRFLNETKNFKKWGFDVKAIRKGLTLDFSSIAKLYAIDNQKGLKFLQQYSDILSSPTGVKTDVPE
jgi:hypothetical protein